MISNDLQHQGEDGGGEQLMDNGGAASWIIRNLAFLPYKVAHTKGAILKSVSMRGFHKIREHIVV